MNTKSTFRKNANNFLTHTTRQKGITLIALVVTIIVLLILAGVSIQMLAGQNSILARARQAQEETKKKEYEEELKMLAMEIKTDMADGTVEDFLTEFKKRVENGTFGGASVSEQEDGSLLFQTEDGFIYKVTEDDIDYLGKDVLTMGTAPTVTITPSRDYDTDTNEHTITLVVTAEDPEGGELSYKLDYGTSEDYGETMSTTGTADSQVTFTLENLDKYTDYYYKVTATDNTDLSGESTGRCKTYCVGLECPGPYDKETECPGCEGVGTTKEKCGRLLTYELYSLR